MPNSKFLFHWYNPRTGEWREKKEVNGGDVELKAPGDQDWVVLLKKK
ncbi:hypothetical protein KUV50_02090 [Membranicola marinus]|uniref:Putative collagen-binding domain-containing protein n=1 Tax=Membranihabitans marinus TaxID=1227546 RepID=A0A953L5S6_9BACT|nr:hypothetical protein [Membranihabitans marinus]